ncbi:MAG: anti-sigma factor [Candidatus Eisenbacteria bacterium]|uniref:Regulator of SigK n=1 Tax=Eiseniibacteriota bacterium TaxID=2212470 RepID=A0A849SPS2_UNCEI|nr:anti-sigma factor [Candidatus Eisenbacteria bacterium]
MSQHSEEFLDLCAGYALGNLDPEQRARLEAHLASGCDACEAALAEMSVASTLLARSAPEQRPSPALKSRVMDAIRAEALPTVIPAAPRPAMVRNGAARGEASGPARDAGAERRAPLAFPGWLTFAPLAAAAALAVTTVLAYRSAEQLRGELQARGEELKSQQAQVQQLERDLSIERHWAAVLSAPGARFAELQITPGGAAALRARATFDPATKSAVVVFENFTPPSGSDYELWLLKGAGVASLGVIKVDEEGRAVLRLDDLGDPALVGGFAISLEPAGGSPFPDRPTGPVVMAGKLGV